MHEVRSISELLDQIRRGEILLPEFQRGYVWNSDQVRGLIQSLYRKHPTGHLLVWKTYRPSLVRGAHVPENGHSLLLLDGQQRLTSLYVLFEGKAPPFYEGESLHHNLYFNIQTEEFRFWNKSLMHQNPAWVSVHEVLNKGLDSILEEMDQLPDETREVYQRNLKRLSRLNQIRDYTYTVDVLSGDEFTVDEVVDIFNRVNKAGTPLTKADLALAHICSIWPEAREEFRSFAAKMTPEGFAISMNYIVRCIAAIAAGNVLLEGAFYRVPASELQAAWGKITEAYLYFITILRNEAYIDSLDDIPSEYVLVPPVVYLAHRGTFPSEEIKRRFIRWFYLAGIWARYTGQTETKLQQDVVLVSGSDPDPTPELEDNILRERGRVNVEASDLLRAWIQSPFFDFSCILARARKAKDWFTGKALYDETIGRSNGRVRYRIFPTKALKSVGTNQLQIHCVPNRVFLAEEPSRAQEKLLPEEYLPKVEEEQPGALRAQCVPLDRSLWSLDRYEEFLTARARLLANEMNEYLASWLPGKETCRADETVVRRWIAQGESESLEFKSSLRWDIQENRVNKEIERIIVKTVAGFLNSRNGGTLLIGVNDQGEVVGLQPDYETLKKQDRDGFELHLRQLLVRDLGESSNSFISVNFHEIDGRDVCQVTVEPSNYPVYVEDGNEAKFFLRVGNATRSLPVSEAVRYVQTRWGGGV